VATEVVDTSEWPGKLDNVCTGDLLVDALAEVLSCLDVAIVDVVAVIFPLVQEVSVLSVVSRTDVILEAVFEVLEVDVDAADLTEDIETAEADVLENPVLAADVDAAETVVRGVVVAVNNADLVVVMEIGMAGVRTDVDDSVAKVDVVLRGVEDRSVPLGKVASVVLLPVWDWTVLVRLMRSDEAREIIADDTAVDATALDVENETCPSSVDRVEDGMSDLARDTVIEEVVSETPGLWALDVVRN